MNLGKPSGILPLVFPVPEAVDHVLIKAFHPTRLGHVCPGVKTHMPELSAYAGGMGKRKARGVVESIVGRNLDALIKHTGVKSNGQVARKIAADFPSRTVGRIRNAETSCSLDTLAKIAKAFNVEPWHLLVPNYDPANPPVRTISKTERDLYARMREDLDQLHEAES